MNVWYSIWNVEYFVLIQKIGGIQSSIFQGDLVIYCFLNFIFFVIFLIFFIFITFFRTSFAGFNISSFFFHSFCMIFRFYFSLYYVCSSSFFAFTLSLLFPCNIFYLTYSIYYYIFNKFIHLMVDFSSFSTIFIAL